MINNIKNNNTIKHNNKNNDNMNKLTNILITKNI